MAQKKVSIPIMFNLKSNLRSEYIFNFGKGQNHYMHERDSAIFLLGHEFIMNPVGGERQSRTRGMVFWTIS